MIPMTLVQHDWTRFLTPEGLAEKSGVPSHLFKQMILKELTDNAMDTGTDVDFYTTGRDEVTISDEGDGINLDAFDIKRPLQSSKHWRTGKRGALGNGLRAVMGALYCLNGYLTVETRGVVTRLSVSDTGDVLTDLIGANDRKGTRITVHCGGIANAVGMAQVATEHFGETISTKRPSPYWFDVEAIRDLQRSAEGVGLSEFCAQFHTRYRPDDDGLASEVDPGQLLALLRNEAMRDPSLRPLGDCYAGEYVKKSGEFEVGGVKLPFVIEVWCEAETGQGEILDHNPIINRTQSLTGLGLYAAAKGRIGMHNGGRSRTLGKAERDKLTLRKTVDYDFTVSITAPYVPILSSGKAPDLQHLIIPILQCVGKAGRKAHNGLKRKAKGVSIIDAVNSLLPAAYDSVSDNGTYWANARQLMYEMRPDILRICGIEKFSDDYITQKCIPEFLDANPDLTADWQIAYDKRGHLVEPHTGRTVGLGTVDVADYTTDRGRIAYDRPVGRVGLLGGLDPEHRFSGLLFVEKEGFTELIKQSGLLERFDLALASTKGMSVTAARALIDDMAGRVDRFVVYVATDFDVTGQSIMHTLTNDTIRYVFQNEVNAVHIGLGWDQAKELHVAGRSEPLEVKDRDKDRMRLLLRGMDRSAVDFLTDDDEPRRVELNALRPVEFIKMLEVGVSGRAKLIPPRTVLADAWRELSIRSRVRTYEAVLRAGDAPAVPHMDDVVEGVTEALSDDPSLSWDAALLDLIEGGGIQMSKVDQLPPAGGHLTRAWNAGFQIERIVPLIPVGGTLFQGGSVTGHDGQPYWEKPAYLDPKSFGKVPGELLQGQWVHRTNWTNRPLTQAEIQPCDAAGASAGLLCGDAFGGLDLDAMDPTLATAWHQHICARLPQVLHRIGQAPKRMIPFHVSGEPVRKTSRRLKRGDDRAVLEVIGQGGQFVLLGLHPATGAPYQWQTEAGLPVAPSVDGLPTLTADQVATIFDELISIAEMHGWTPDRKSALRTGEAGTSDLDKADPNVIAAVVREIPNSSNMDTWVRVGLAIKTELGDEGWPIWKDWSDRWTEGKDTEKSLRRTYDKFRPEGLLSFGTIRQLATDLDVTFTPQTQSLIDADLGERQNKKRVASAIAAGMPEVAPEVPQDAEVIQAPADSPVTQQVYRGPVRGEFSVNEKNELVWSLTTALAMLESNDAWADVLAFNEFSGEYMITAPIPFTDTARFVPHEMGDGDVADAENWFNRCGFPRATETTIFKALKMAAEANVINPVRQYLSEVEWDGVARLETWLTTYLGAWDSLYTRAIGRCTLISAVARVMQPGCKVDTMLILEGTQGMRKSQALRILAGDAYFTDAMPDLKSKDAADQIRGIFIAEMAELEMVNRSSMETTKAFLSRQEDRYRPAYGRTRITQKRQCIFIGTTNQDNYLRDETGSRRFWPIAITAINLDALKRDRDQIWAEAVAEYQAGTPWWLDSSIEIIAQGEQKKRGEDDPWTGAVLGYASQRAAVTCGEILQFALYVEISKQDRGPTKRVTGILKANGWVRAGRASSGTFKGNTLYVRTG